MAQDEGRFGRISRPKRCWAPSGIRPAVPSQIVRESMYVFAAFAPSQGRLVSLILPTANTAMMNLFLEHLSQELADYFIVMQVFTLCSRLPICYPRPYPGSDAFPLAVNFPNYPPLTKLSASLMSLI